MKLEILGYIKEQQALFVQLGTKYIWKYVPVTKEMYEELLNSKAKTKTFKQMVHDYFLVGSIKEVNNDFKF